MFRLPAALLPVLASLTSLAAEAVRQLGYARLAGVMALEHVFPPST